MPIVIHGQWMYKPDHDESGVFFVWGVMPPAPDATDAPPARLRPGQTRPRVDRTTPLPLPHPITPHETLAVVAGVAALFSADGAPPNVKGTPAQALALLPTAADAPMLVPGVVAPADTVALRTWIASGTALSPLDALTLLTALPHGPIDPAILPPDCIIGDDLRFYSIAAKFALDLLARQKVLPALELNALGGKTVRSRWQMVVDERQDRERFDRLVAALPPSCRALRPLTPPTNERPPQALDPARMSAAADVLHSFLDAIADSAARAWAGAVHNAPADKDVKAASANVRLGQQWADNLFVAPSDEPTFETTSVQAGGLHDQYVTWTDTLQGMGEGAFRLCFRLEPPAHPVYEGVEIEADFAPPPGTVRGPSFIMGATDRGRAALASATALLARPPAERPDWTLSYLLQATDDPSLLVPAETVWQERGDVLNYLNRRFDRPQERMLAGLGQATRLFKPIETSLRVSRPTSVALTVNDAYAFLREAAPLLESSGFGILVPPWWMQKSARLATRLTLSSPADVQETSGLLSLDALVAYNWELSLGGQALTREEFEHLAAMKLPLMQVRGEWVVLDPAQVEAAIAFYDKHTNSGTMTLREALQAGFDPGTIEEDGAPGLNVEGVVADGWINELLEQLTGGSGGRRMEEIRQPDDFIGTLRPYQLRGVSWLNYLRQWGLGACLADDMGLGKTIQMLALLLHDKHQASRARPVLPNRTTAPAPKKRGRPRKNAVVAAAMAQGAADSGPLYIENGDGEERTNGPALLICPTSVVGNWRREAGKFAPALRVMVHHGSDRLSGERFLQTAAAHDLVISSYSLVHRDAAFLQELRWGGVILDEAQNIKNPAAKQTQAVRALNAGYRIALTGTPVENRLAELWSIMEFLNPGYLGSQTEFRSTYALPIERYRQPETMQRLKALVQPFILRRLKSDPSIIQDLPDKMEMKVFCNLTQEQASLYQAAVKDVMAQIEAAEGTFGRNGLVFSLLTKLKQICNHPAQFLGDKSRLDGRSGKLTRLTEMLEEVLAEGDNAIIFTQYAEMGKLLQKYLAEHFGREVAFLYGATPARERDAMVERFQSGKGPSLFILSTKAGGTGLNLTEANHVFHYDRWWNPAIENQATDRAYRIGQTRTVEVHKFICAGTLEDRIDQLIESKRALAENIIGTGEDILTTLSSAELRDILTLRTEAVQDD